MKCVLSGIRLDVRGAVIPFKGIEMIPNVRSKQQSCQETRRSRREGLRSADIMSLAFKPLSDNSYAVVALPREATPDRISGPTGSPADAYQIIWIDRNFGGEVE